MWRLTNNDTSWPVDSEWQTYGDAMMYVDEEVNPVLGDPSGWLDGGDNDDWDMVWDRETKQWIPPYTRKDVWGITWKIEYVD